ncbi:amino acid ABC transporter ATP-binding/permease protein, partial [Paucilactobacillus nenjiangensis]
VMRNNLYGNLTDNVLGISDWIFSQRGHDYVELHEKSEAELHEVRDRLLRFKRYRDLIVQVVFGTIVIVTLFWTGNSFQGVHGSGMTNWIAAFVLGIFPLINSFEPLSQAAEESSTYQDSIHRFNELPDETEKATAIESLTGPLTIAIDHLDFSYDNSSKQILKDLNIQIAPGEKIAILGKSGSGKSTLTHLLHGDLEPTNGQVTINDIKTNVLNDDIDRYIGVINQAPYLFNTTIANNLRIGDEAASDDKLWDVLDRVGLKEMIQKLPNGLGTLVDEAGLRFSGGERHRLSLARILLKDVPIIILDEPTVGLDPITEQGLINTFFNQLEGKTVIWVTHHLQGVDSMDKVIFIEDGQIEMQGTPTELNQTNQRFRELKAIDAGF